MSNSAPSIQHIKEQLETHKIQPSLHRIKILEYLLTHFTHPSVEIIYNSISPQIPTLSKTTVYNTLNLFAEKGIVIPLTIEENELRYDINTSNHLHFRCTECNTIYDIDEDLDIYHRKEIEGHSIQFCHVYLRGICSGCR